MRSSLALWRLTALFGFLGVAFGAFGAHGLANKIDARSLEIWEIGVKYQMWHALALGLVAVMHERGGERAARFAGLSFTAGIVLFSFSLYALALGAPKWFGAITPFGGVLLMLGWLAFLGRAASGITERASAS